MDTKCSNFPYTAVLSKVEIRCRNTTIGYVQTYRKKGSIRCLEVTEKQYATMKLLLGELKTQEKRVKFRPTIIIFKPYFLDKIKREPLHDKGFR